MDLLRQAAQQMVTAMESHPHSMVESPENCWNYTRDLALDALRAALAQPERKPLTDEEMRECAQAMDAEPLAEGWSELIKFARAIERAHGIE